MRAVIQRVSSASVKVAGEEISAIGPGFLVLLGIRVDDGPDDVDYMVRKISGLRIFYDQDERMRLNLQDVGGAVLVVPQFTLYGDVRKGNRPSFSQAAPPELGRNLYETVMRGIKNLGLPVSGGRFRETMTVELVNDGPVTILLDSKKEF
ncbi:MAG: D-tyrosyl-tRNA(Tyr) deacylase [Deltaproteobacteria bacterium]|nr:D-tyrosyl-tRNA(Tyr) deacylase [Candidatus Tharpella aukensis]